MPWIISLALAAVLGALLFGGGYLAGGGGGGGTGCAAPDEAFAAFVRGVRPAAERVRGRPRQRQACRGRHPRHVPVRRRGSLLGVHGARAIQPGARRPVRLLQRDRRRDGHPQHGRRRRPRRLHGAQRDVPAGGRSAAGGLAGGASGAAGGRFRARGRRRVGRRNDHGGPDLADPRRVGDRCDPHPRAGRAGALRRHDHP